MPNSDFHEISVNKQRNLSNVSAASLAGTKLPIDDYTLQLLTPQKELRLKLRSHADVARTSMLQKNPAQGDFASELTAAFAEVRNSIAFVPDSFRTTAVRHCFLPAYYNRLMNSWI